MPKHANLPVIETASGSPRTCTRTFPARADQISQARAFVREILAGCQLADDAALICSELATNAVLHSDSAKPGGWFTVRAEIRDGDYVWVEVEDQGGRWAEDASSDEGGRGLDIVTALAAYWDIEGDEQARVVCARLDWPGLISDRA